MASAAVKMGGGWFRGDRRRLVGCDTGERELKLRFVLTQEADSANNQEVLLKLEEPEDGSNQYRKYKELRYTIRRSFTSDFDF